MSKETYFEEKEEGGTLSCGLTLFDLLLLFSTLLVLSDNGDPVYGITYCR